MSDWLISSHGAVKYVDIHSITTQRSSYVFPIYDIVAVVKTGKKIPLVKDLQYNQIQLHLPGIIKKLEEHQTKKIESSDIN